MSYRDWLQKVYPSLVPRYDRLNARATEDFETRLLRGIHESNVDAPVVREAIDRMLHYSRKIPAVKLSKDAHHTWKRMLRVQEIRRRMGSIKHQATLYCMADAQHRMEVAR